MIMTHVTLDPLPVYSRGLADPNSLTPHERMVYLLIDLEALMDMEGWDEFFTSHVVRDQEELKSALKMIGDFDSLEVIEHYERHFSEHDVAFEPQAIDSFLCRCGPDYLRNCRDWRKDYSQFTEARWRKVSEFLHQRGIELLT
jgi:hypothetical protein